MSEMSELSESSLSDADQSRSSEPCTCRWREGTIGGMQVYQELRKATARDCCHEADGALCSEATGGRTDVALLSMLPLTGAGLLQGFRMLLP